MSTPGWSAGPGDPNQPGPQYAAPYYPAGPPQYAPSGYPSGYQPYPPQGYPPGYPSSGPGFGPGLSPGLAPDEKPSPHWGWAIASLLLFWPLAIPSFIFASRVDPAWFRGDRFGAAEASRQARMFGMIGTIIGAVLGVVVIVWIIFVFVVFATAVHNISTDFPPYTPVPFPT